MPASSLTIIINQDVLPIDMLERQAKKNPEKVYLRQPVGDEVLEYTWAEVFDKTLRLAEAFRQQGWVAGDRVAILASNCAEWFITDYALLAAGLVPTPIYATAGHSIIQHVLEHSEAKGVVVGSIANPDVVVSAAPEGVVIIGMSTADLATDLNIQDLIAQHEPIAEYAKPSIDDTFSIVYTSGSTGKPKGVVATYGNICYAAAASITLMSGDGAEERYLSYLPLAHVTERSLVEYNSLYCGATVTFNHSLDTFGRDLMSAKVTQFISVPRLWVKFQSQILANIPEQKLKLMLRIPILSGVIKRKIKAQMGLANVTTVGSGSAPISPAILEWYHNIGIDICEGWGMTETAGMATSHLPFRLDKLGTIGQAVEGFEIRISDVGEILIRGDGVFKEYYKNPEATAETFTDDGFLRTGDKGELDSEGFLRITGRVKDLFKSGKGKYVAPVPIEGKMASNLIIEQLCVMGSGLPKAVCVVVLSEEVAGEMSKEAISASLVETMNEVNGQIEKHEVMGGIFIAKDPWTIENGLLTPTLKVKRAELEQKYMAIVSEPQPELVTWEA
jgi:long-chain acyl-CoA synthetase